MLHFPQELNFPTQEWASVVKDNYYYLFFPSILYYIAIRVGQKWMEDRKPYNVSKVLIWWNLLLTVFSIIGTNRMWNEVMTATSESSSLVSSVCISGVRTPRAGLWFVLFAFSKFVEFGDTFFLIVKKKPVIFLHWYHHITVMLLTFHIWANLHPSGRYCSLMNFFVHSIMYGYYTLTAMKIKMHPEIAFCVTSLQLSQMFYGLAIAILTILNCSQHTTSSGYFALFIYSSYAVLFAKFMIESYFSKKRRNSMVSSKSFSSFDNNNNIKMKGA